MSDRRNSKRRCAARSGQQHGGAMPSASHYVGYVEEDETPEMIMKKFEELEKVMAARQTTVQPDSSSGQAAEGSEAAEAAAAAAAPEDGAALTEEEMLHLFKQTSIFNVKSALAGNEVLMAGDDAELNDRDFSDDDLSDDGNGDWEQLKGFWSDEDEEEYKKHWRNARKARKGTRLQKAVRERKVVGQETRLRPDVVTHYNAVTQALIRKRVVEEDRDALQQIRIPIPPMPLSWGRIVQPYEPASASKGLRTVHTGHAAAAAPANDENVDRNGGAAPADPAASESVYIEAASALSADYNALGKKFIGVLINSAWEQGCKDYDQAKTYVDKLAKIPVPKLCPAGFIFVWAEKENTAALVRQMYKWGFIYVENLTWCLQAPNNELLKLQSAYVRRSHITLFIFRKEGLGKDIELRHQRNPDVVFDFVAASKGQPHSVPEEVFVAIETLLPAAKGKLLELWAPAGVRRPGWTHIVQASAA